MFHEFGLPGRMRRREDSEMVKVFFLLVGLPFSMSCVQETAFASSKLKVSSVRNVNYCMYPYLHPLNT